MSATPSRYTQQSMSKLSRAIVIIAVGVLLLSAGGCGNSTFRSSQKIKLDNEELNIGRDRSKIGLGAIECYSFQENSKDYPKTYLGSAVTELIEIFRQNPTITSQGETIRAVLAKEAESLELCWPEDARRIRNALTYG